MLTYALDASGKMVYIGSVERGLSCNCRCPECDEPLVAKLGHDGGRQPHFAHSKGSDCHGAYMTALHRLAEQIIEEEKAVMAPAYKEIEMRRLSFKEIEVERRTERKDLQPDIVGVTEDGLRWSIEIRYTHEIDERKKAKLQESGITCLEIDVREQTLENLRPFLLESADNREWINNPIYDSQIMDRKRKRVFQIEKLITEKHELRLPNYKDIPSQSILLNDVAVMSKSDDGLNETLKVTSSDGATYIIDICTLETQKNSNVLTEEHQGCHVLEIIADNFTNHADIQLDNIDTRWVHHYVSESERILQKNAFREHKENLVQEKFCHFLCRFRLPNVNCEYENGTIVYKEQKFVICDNAELRRKKKSSDAVNMPSVNSSADARPQWATKKLFADDRATSDSLPFERSWTIDEYYACLSSNGYFPTPKGNKARVIRCKKIGQKILLLYEDTLKNTYLPFHIIIIFSHRGELKYDLGGSFSFEKQALRSFGDRSEAMKFRSLLTENDNEDLPF